MTLVGVTAANAARTSSQPVVYGVDGRQEVYEVTDPQHRAHAERSAVALVSAYQIDTTNPNDVELTGTPLRQARNLCPDELFIEQPTASFCSGVLIAPDLVLTAGHCIADPSGMCPSLRFVFNYYYSAPGVRQQITRDDVYACREVHVREESGGMIAGNTRDFAIVQLDRPVDGAFEPADVRTERTALPNGTDLVMVGVPSGIPLKVEASGSVRDNRANNLDVFVANTDSFGGNSGSGVWNAVTDEMVGILVSGVEDYVQDENCYRVNSCTDSGCGGENIVYAFNAIDAFCEVGTNEDLCGTAPQCGDGFCAYNETCAADCDPPVCGDGFCHIDEYEGCPQDCPDGTIPEGWTCNPDWYGAYEGCDSSCGVPDPDCNLNNSGDIGDIFSGCNASTTSASTWLTILLAATGLLGLLIVVRRRQRA